MVETGTHLAHCEIHAKLGEGGVGVVYRAGRWPQVEVSPG